MAKGARDVEFDGCRAGDQIQHKKYRKKNRIIIEIAKVEYGLP